jgi:hypothetical protein
MFITFSGYNRPHCRAHFVLLLVRFPTEDHQAAILNQTDASDRDAVTVEPVGDFTLKGIVRPMAACNGLSAVLSKI